MKPYSQIESDSYSIYGFAEYSDGSATTGAVVHVVSNISTIITVCYSPGHWEVEPPWPTGTAFTVYVKGCCGHNGWFGKKQGILPEQDIDMGTIIVYPNQVPNPPHIIEYPLGLQTGNNGEFIVKGTDPDDLHELKYRFDWDANNTHQKSNFTEYVENNHSAMKTHAWDKPGKYLVKAQAVDEFGLSSNWSEGVIVTVYESNFAPLPPELSGPDVFQKNTMQFFTLTTTDPENENVFYQINWGNGNITNWIGPYESGEIVVLKQSWTVAGSYSITARAKDAISIVGNWSDPKQVQVTEPQLEIQNVRIGIGKIIADIENKGTGTAENVSWNITINGQWIFSGESTENHLLEIAAGEEKTVSSNFILGFGPVIIQITAIAENDSNDEESIDAELFFCFILT